MREAYIKTAGVIKAALARNLTTHELTVPSKVPSFKCSLVIVII